MSWFTSFFKRSTKEPITDEDFSRGLGVIDSSTGLPTTRTTVMGVAAVWAAVRLISESVASLPLLFYRRVDQGKERAVNDPLFNLLWLKPNPEQTSFYFRETLQHHVLLKGNAYAQKIHNRLGEVMELWPLDPEKMRVFRDNDTRQILYEYTTARGTSVHTRNEILHIPGLGWDGIKGYSPIQILMREFGYDLAVKEYGSEYFKNTDGSGDYVSLPTRFKDDDARIRFKKSWRGDHTEWGRKHSMRVLEEGAELKHVAIAPDEAQFIESQKMTVTDVARIFRVPPHMIADLERATFSNIEQQSIDFVTNSLRPWLVRWEQELHVQIIPLRQQQQYFYEFLINALLRGDFATRMQGYRTAIEMGGMTQNEMRSLENMNTKEGLDDNWVPLNWQKIDDSDLNISQDSGFITDNAAPVIKETRTAQERFKLGNSFRKVFEDVIQNILKREIRDLKKGVKEFLPVRALQDFQLFMDKYYQNELPDVIRRRITPTYRVFFEQVKQGLGREIDIDTELTPEDEEFIRAFVTLFIRRYIAKSQSDIAKAIDRSADVDIPVAQALDETTEHWETDRANFTAHNETVRGGNAFAKTVYVAAGVTLLRWVTIGENCPFCDSLNGRVVGVESDFALPNDEIVAKGASMGVNSKIGHPPIHRGCDCQIVAGG